MIIEKILGIAVGIAIIETILHIPPIKRAYKNSRLKAIEREKRQIRKEIIEDDIKNETFRASSKREKSYEDWKAEQKSKEEENI